jgi:hypothetical protein
MLDGFLLVWRGLALQWDGERIDLDLEADIGQMRDP